MEMYPPALQELLTAVKKNGYHAKPHPAEQVMQIARSTPQQIPTLARAFIDDLPDKGSCLAPALSFLAPDAFPSLVEYALAALQLDHQNQSAASVVECASLECPETLRPHLRTLLPLAVQTDNPQFAKAWRATEPHEALFLKTVFEDETREEAVRKFACKALLETRHEPLLQVIGRDRPNDLLEDGYTLEQGVLRKLYPDVTSHLRFVDDYPDPSAPWPQRDHPTWCLPTTEGSALTLGGEVPEEIVCECLSCGEAIHHLLTLDSVPDGLGVTAVARLTLAVCLSCLGCEHDMEVAFYQHNAHGLPVAHLWGDGPRIVPQFPAGPLQQTMVRLMATPARWVEQGWGDYGNNFRVGGPPAWVQDAEYPDCPTCTRKMPFLLQLDSDLSMEGVPFDPQHTGWLWGIGGMAYIYWCDECKISAAYWQCT